MRKYSLAEFWPPKCRGARRCFPAQMRGRGLSFQ